MLLREIVKFNKSNINLCLLFDFTDCSVMFSILSTFQFNIHIQCLFVFPIIFANICNKNSEYSQFKYLTRKIFKILRKRGKKSKNFNKLQKLTNTQWMLPTAAHKVYKTITQLVILLALGIILFCMSFRTPRANTRKPIKVQTGLIVARHCGISLLPKIIYLSTIKKK